MVGSDEGFDIKSIRVSEGKERQTYTQRQTDLGRGGGTEKSDY